MDLKIQKSQIAALQARKFAAIDRNLAVAQSTRHRTVDIGWDAAAAL
jgi:hypothetical protein